MKLKKIRLILFVKIVSLTRRFQNVKSKVKFICFFVFVAYLFLLLRHDCALILLFTYLVLFSSTSLTEFKISFVHFDSSSRSLPPLFRPCSFTFNVYFRDCEVGYRPTLKAKGSQDSHNLLPLQNPFVNKLRTTV